MIHAIWYGKSLFFGSFFLLLPFYYIDDIWRDFFLGIWEKQHGYLMIIGSIIVWLALSVCTRAEYHRLTQIVLVSSSIVAIIAIIEWLGYNIFTGWPYLSVGSWGTIRSASTLGNPNYTAWYLLFLLPLIVTLPVRLRYFLFVFFTLAILSTGSLIGISFTLLYLFFLSVSHVFPRERWYIFGSVILIWAIWAILLFFGSEKWLSLISRFILMKHTLMMMWESISGLLFWYGPDAIIHFFSASRPDEIVSYFPDRMIIDSSHNIFIDVFAFYGIFGLVACLSLIIYRYPRLPSYAISGLVLGLGFLSLNVFVISHILLILFLLRAQK